MIYDVYLDGFDLLPIIHGGSMTVFWGRYCDGTLWYSWN